MVAARLLMRMVIGGGVALFAWPVASQEFASQEFASCKGDTMKRFIGAPVESMQKVRNANVRYVCTTCPMTKDYRMDRLTVLFDGRTRLITEMRCV